MPKKNQRPTAEHIMEFLEPNKGYAIRFSYIYKEMRKNGHKHNSSSISQNLTYLIEQGKIVRIQHKVNESFYGIPKKRSDGSTYIIAKKVYVEDEEIELGK